MKAVRQLLVVVIVGVPGWFGPPGADAFVGVLGVGTLAAQDVELLGERYGTRPPPAYYDELRRDPNAFQFQREGLERLRHIQESRGLRFRDLIQYDGGPARSLGPRDAPVVGTFPFPLVLGLFADSPANPPFSRDEVAREYFDGPNSYHQTIPEYYAEISRGRAELLGTTFEWGRSQLTRDEVTLGSSGLSSHSTLGVGAYIESLLDELDAQGVDWSQFDHTGDGFVDVLTVMHPTHGAECAGGGANRIWSHRWTLSSVTQGRLHPGYETSTPRPDGQGFIYINDYTIQPVMACNAEDINQIGIFAHELGHGFGLPDLYATRGGSHRGAGSWDLMGTGAWGCHDADPSRPCHMGAWSKAMLGWVDVEELPVGQEVGEVLLEPVFESGRVLKVPAGDGSGEYLLLENRQRLGSDIHLYEPGLLVWHVAPAVIDVRWSSNTVNNDAARMGVWLRQADGRNRLATSGGYRGGRGDPYPGCILPDSLRFDPTAECEHNRAFHAGTVPAAFSHQGRPMGMTLSGIEQVGAAPHQVRFHLDTRFQWDTVSVDATAEAVREEVIQLEVTGGQGPIQWRFVGGELPDGYLFDAGAGRVHGLTFDTGLFVFSVSAVDGIGREVYATVTLEVTAPIIPAEELVAVFLGKPDPLTPELRIFLDHLGNRNGTYDLGDLRAYLQAHPNLPMSAESARFIEVLIPMSPSPPEGRWR